MSGSVITSENPIYQKIKDIDIFNLKALNKVKELEMEIVSTAENTRSLFTHEEIVFGESGSEKIRKEKKVTEKTQNLKSKPENSSDDVAELEKNELDDLNKKIDILEKDKKSLEAEVLKKIREIDELKKNHRSEGFSRGHAEGISKGIAEGRKRIEECCNLIKNEVAEISLKLEDETAVIGNDVAELVSFLFQKILGMNDKNETAKSLINQIKDSFPRENRIILKCSADMAELFFQEKDSVFEIRVDSTMKEGSVFVETTEIVADFSLKNQLSKMISKLKEDL